MQNTCQWYCKNQHLRQYRAPILLIAIVEEHEEEDSNDVLFPPRPCCCCLSSHRRCHCRCRCSHHCCFYVHHVVHILLCSALTEEVDGALSSLSFLTSLVSSSAGDQPFPCLFLCGFFPPSPTVPTVHGGRKMTVMSCYWFSLFF